MENTPLASALSRVHLVAKKYGGSIVPSREIERRDRELLVRTNWLREIIRGWYMLTRPDVVPGDTSSWYANFWDFVQIYLKEVYGSAYCLSAEDSVDLHIGNPIIPKQVVAIVEKGGGNPILLPFDTSILVYADPKNFPTERTTVRELQVMSLPLALCKIAPVFFSKHPIDAEIALCSIKDLQELIYIITTHNFVRAAERIIGAFQALKEPEKADFIAQQLKTMGMSLKPVDPFQSAPLSVKSVDSPYKARIFSLWTHFRPTIMQHFPPPPGLPKNPSTYLKEIDELYTRDAYNSLSIEGYQVNAQLIQRIQENAWNPDLILADQEQRNALAARGYYEAFLEVKKAIARVLKGESPGKVIMEELQNWFRALFFPNIQAGLLHPSEVLGYRRSQVYIRNSRHVPLPKEALVNAMEAFFTCLQEENHPAVRSILFHFLF